MKVVVVGLGKVGRNILQCLVEERHDIVAIDENAETVQDIVDRYDVKGLCGNGCIAENLEEAGADTADLLLSVTPSDEQNVLCCLDSKEPRREEHPSPACAIPNIISRRISCGKS